MALPTPPPYSNPIPNNPFYSPLNPYVCGPYFPVAMSSGIDITTGAVVPKLVNEVDNVLAAGPGIALSTLMGVTTITATGGGGGGTPATPTVEGIVYGCTDSTNFNYGLGDNIFTALTTGILNVAIGAGALATNDAGTSNTALGIGALFANTSGNQNVAVGQQALAQGTTANLNVAVGSQSLQNATGDANTAIGNFAGNTVTSGSKNVILGHNGAPDTPVFTVTTEDNRVVVGTTAITNAYVQVAWTVVSDARDKIVQGNVPHGLDFVKQLEPKAFHFKETRDSETPHGPLRYGFLAQDILALEGEKGVIIDNEDADKLRYNGEALVPVLVNAIKELSTKVEELEAKLAAHG